MRFCTSHDMWGGGGGGDKVKLTKCDKEEWDEKCYYASNSWLTCCFIVILL